MDILHISAFFTHDVHLYGLQFPPPSSGKYIHTLNGGCVGEREGPGGRGMKERKREGLLQGHLLKMRPYLISKSGYCTVSIHNCIIQYQLTVPYQGKYIHCLHTLVYRTHSLCTYYKKNS